MHTLARHPSNVNTADDPRSPFVGAEKSVIRPVTGLERDPRRPLEPGGTPAGVDPSRANQQLAIIRAVMWFNVDIPTALAAISVLTLIITFTNDIRKSLAEGGPHWKTTVSVAAVLFALNLAANLGQQYMDAKAKGAAKSTDAAAARDRAQLNQRLEIISADLERTFANIEPHLSQVSPTTGSEIREQVTVLRREISNVSTQVKAIETGNSSAYAALTASVTNLAAIVEHFRDNAVAVTAVAVAKALPRPRVPPPATPLQVFTPIVVPPPPSPAVQPAPVPRPLPPPITVVGPLTEQEVPPPRLDGDWVGNADFGVAVGRVRLTGQGDGRLVEVAAPGIAEDAIVRYAASQFEITLDESQLTITGRFDDRDSVSATISRGAIRFPFKLQRTVADSRSPVNEPSSVIPTFVDLRGECANYYGTRVPTALRLDLPVPIDTARSSVAAAILVNPILLSSVPPIVQAFWYGHVCAHLRLPAPYNSSEVLMTCWAFLRLDSNPRYPGVLSMRHYQLVEALSSMPPSYNPHFPSGAGAAAVLTNECSMFNPILLQGF